MSKRALCLLVAFVVGYVAAFGTMAVLDRAAPSPTPLGYGFEAAPAHSTKGLAEKLTPPVQSYLNAHRDDFAKHAGGPMERLAVRWGLPVACREVPVLLESGLDELATELHTWTLGDILGWLESVAKEKNLPPPRAAREYHGEAVQTRDGGVEGRPMSTLYDRQCIVCGKDHRGGWPPQPCDPRDLEARDNAHRHASDEPRPIEVRARSESGRLRDGFLMMNPHGDD